MAMDFSVKPGLQNQDSQISSCDEVPLFVVLSDSPHWSTSALWYLQKELSVRKDAPIFMEATGVSTGIYKSIHKIE